MVITEGKSHSDRNFVLIGVLGALTTFTGLFVTFQPPYFIIGSFLLLLTATYFKVYFFVALEIIFISGHVATLLGIGPALLIALPVLLSFQLMFYYLFSGQTSDLTIIIGVSGIALITIGFLIDSTLILFFGSLSVSIYAYFNFKKSNQISLIWLILNLMFALIALSRIITT